jgi:hypothetical protein
MHVFIKMNAHTCMSIYVYTVFLKTKIFNYTFHSENEKRLIPSTREHIKVRQCLS